FGVENAHHQFFAEGGGQRGQTQLHLVAVSRASLDASVLRAALFDHIHAAENLDAAGHRRDDGRRQLIDVVQHAIDAEAHLTDFATRLDVNIAGALIEGVLPQPVDDIDDVLVVGVELPVALAEFDQLLEVRKFRALLRAAGCALHRFGEVVELDDVPVDVERIGKYALDVHAHHLREFALPFRDVGFGGGDHRFAAP